MANVIELLQKLINHERSARTIGSIAEADAFAGKIEKLLFENNLSMADVMPAPPRTYRPQYPQTPRSHRRPKWHDDLATEKQIRTIEKLYRCTAPPLMTKGVASMLIEMFFAERESA